MHRSPPEPPSQPASLDDAALSALRGVDAALAKRLETLSLFTVRDLLFHLPFRYRDLTRLTPIAELRDGEDAVVSGVIASRARVGGRRAHMVCELRDSSGALTLRFFRFSEGLWRWFAPGVRMRCVGAPRRRRSGVEMHHPEQCVSGERAPPLPSALSPVYPSVDGVSQRNWRSCIAEALRWMDSAGLADPLAELPRLASDGGELGELLSLSLEQALRQLHAPTPGSEPQTERARRRLALEEMVAQLLGVLRLRASHRRCAATPIAPISGECARRFEARLGFEMTGAQRRVADEIQRDLSRPKPMMRLVQGDVGCGKTALAAWAALHAARSGVQAALMAPTEILCEQHSAVLGRLLGPLDVPTVSLSGRTRGRSRERALASLAAGDALLAIGTHALFQGGVAFRSLGLSIIDEQHRFGVHQRLALREKRDGDGAAPHQLVMTATPIPRSLALSAFANLDRSVVDELPPGRRAVITAAVNNRRRDEVIARIREQVQRGERCYWVCVLIEESEKLQAQAVGATAEMLGAALPGLRVATVHGQMKAKEKADAMAAFRAGDVQVLVATTVIEVGVDVPSANLMVIENAERLGLAQLHQLRGRVGRAAAQAYCLLTYQEPLSEVGRARLDALRRHADGFAIAERDLELRGPGELLGVRQAGKRLYRIAELPGDAALLPAAHQAARALRASRPERAEFLLRRWFGPDRREEAG